MGSVFVSESSILIFRFGVFVVMLWMFTFFVQLILMGTYFISWISCMLATALKSVSESAADRRAFTWIVITSLSSSTS